MNIERGEIWLMNLDPAVGQKYVKLDQLSLSVLINESDSRKQMKKIFYVLSLFSSSRSLLTFYYLVSIIQKRIAPSPSLKLNSIQNITSAISPMSP